MRITLINPPIDSVLANGHVSPVTAYLFFNSAPLGILYVAAVRETGAQKVFVKEVFIAGTLVEIHAVAKGSGMIAPALATTLCFITTDALITVKALRQSLSDTVDSTLNQLTVDGDMSTNDAVVMLANGAADNELIEQGTDNHGWFTEALRELLVDVARSIAKDGEGATRMIEVSVEGAASLADAGALSVAVADSSLVKAAVFGADPYAWGRILAALGGRAGRTKADFDPSTLSLTLQGVKVFDRGKPIKDSVGQLKFRMSEREIAVVADLGENGFLRSQIPLILGAERTGLSHFDPVADLRWRAQATPRLL